MTWLTVLWVALWGSITWANVLGGVAVAAAVVASARLDPATLRPTYFRPHWAVWYVLNVAWQLVVSNVRLAWEVFTPGDGTHTAIVAIPIRGGSDAVVNLVANSITLTPGTMTIDVKRHDDDRAADDLQDEDRADEDLQVAARTDHDAHEGAAAPGVTLYVHGIFAHDLDGMRRDVLRLEELALRAFGSEADFRLAHADVEVASRR